MEGYQSSILGEPGALVLLLNFYGYYLPIILYVMWAPLALMDLVKREDVSATKGSLWTAAILFLPLVGAGLYHLIENKSHPAWLRYNLVGVGTGLIVLMTILSTTMGY